MKTWQIRWRTAVVAVALVLAGLHATGEVARRPTEVDALALALVVLLVGGLLARRHVRRAKALLDPRRYQPATLHESRLVIDGDAEAYVVVGTTPAAGRVFVRRQPNGETGYRATRSLRADDIVGLDPAAVWGVAELRATASLRIAFWLALSCATVAPVEAIGAYVCAPPVVRAD